MPDIRLALPSTLHLYEQPFCLAAGLHWGRGGGFVSSTLGQARQVHVLGGQFSQQQPRPGLERWGRLMGGLSNTSCFLAPLTPNQLARASPLHPCHSLPIFCLLGQPKYPPGCSVPARQHQMLWDAAQRLTVPPCPVLPLLAWVDSHCSRKPQDHMIATQGTRTGFAVHCRPYQASGPQPRSGR